MYISIEVKKLREHIWENMKTKRNKTHNGEMCNAAAHKYMQVYNAQNSWMNERKKMETKWVVTYCVGGM